MSQPLQAILVSKDASVRDAMMAIDRGASAIALVVDGARKLLGIMTDGDIRRALLRGESLDARIEPLMNRRFTAVQECTSRSEVLDLMRARTLQEIPIVDRNGVLVGLHLMREIVGGRRLSNWAVIMAGGRGERLRPLTDSLPKPMIKVAGRPILERIVLHLVGHGIRRIFLSVNYKAEVIENHFGDGQAFGCRVDYLREATSLGTGGALSLLPEKPDAPILVLNGDLLTQADVGAMLAFHSAGQFKISVGVHEYVHTVPYGVLDLEGDRVVGMREKPSESWTANAGLYVIDPGLISRVPRDTHFPLPALVEESLESGEGVGAFRIMEDWIDIGQHQELKRARGEENK